MKRLVLLIFALVVLVAPALAQNDAVNGYCTLGASKALVSNLQSSNLQQGIIPKCTVTVYYTGTTTIVNPIYSNVSGAALTNPFTATVSGQWLFFAATGIHVDIVMSGGTPPNSFPTAVPLTDVVVGGGGTGGGGVNIIIPGSNVTCSPNIGGHCAGNVTVNAASGGAGNPTGLGVSQYANLTGNAFFSGGTINTDVNNTANNGIAVTRASILCGLLCPMFVPPTSTDTEGGGSLNVNAAGPSSFLEDWRWGGHHQYGTNPQPGAYTLSPFQWQVMQNEGVFYSLPNPSAVQGSQQVKTNMLNEFDSPGYSLGDSACPPNCPGTGHTSAGNWSVSKVFDDSTRFLGSGIRDYEGHTIFCVGGEGDCSREETNFFYEGGCTTFSDECAYSEIGSHAMNLADPFDVIGSIIDNNHIKITTAIASEGNNRNFIDVTAPVLLHGAIQSINPAGVIHPIPTISYDAAHGSIPASYARGTVVGTCQVPIQEGTFVNGVNCTFAVQSGTIDVTGSGAADGVGLFCYAEDHGGNINIGVRVTAVSALSGGQQTATLAGVNRSVVTGGGFTGYFFQGGTCGAVVNFDNDGLVDGGKFVSPSAFTSIGSYDTHTATAIYYAASGLWTTPGGVGSFQATQATSGPLMGSVLLTSLVRNAGVLSANFFDQGGAQDFINGQIATTISGCSDSSVNGVQTGTPFMTAFGGLVMNQAGANTSCPTATITVQSVGSSVFWAMRVFDVLNHSTAPGTNPFDGTITGSYQPHFVVGHTIEMPPNPSMQISARHTSMDMQQPCVLLCAGYQVIETNQSAYDGPAFYGLNSSYVQNSTKISGLGGTAKASDFARADGWWTSMFTSQYAPAHYGHLIGWQSFNPAFPPALQNTDVLWLDSGTRALHFDEPSSTWSFRFNDPVSFAPNNSALDISRTGSVSWLPHAFTTAQFFDPTDTIVTQIKSAGARGTLTGASAYDAAIDAPVVTVNSPGTTQQDYLIQVTTPWGISWSKLVHAFNAATTPNNTISCSVMPAGSTGTVYRFINPNFQLVGASANQCVTPATNVTDTGTYTGFFGSEALSAGANFLTGSVSANANGFFGFTQADNFNDAGDPRTITTQLSQKSAGVISVDTIAKGNGLGEVDAAVFKQAGNVVCTAANGLCTGGVVGVSTINGTPGAFTFTGAGVSCTTTTCTFTGTSGGVSTFNARSGAVVPAGGDYSFSLLSGNMGNTQGPSSLTGILKDAAGTLSVAVAADFPTLNQTTTGSAAKWTTARNLAGNSVDGSANVAFANKFIVQGTADSGLSGAQFLGALGTCLLKNTTTTGVLSCGAAGTDYLAINGSSAGLSVATSSAFGVVKPDNSTIAISGGIISAIGAGSGTVTTSGSPTTNTLSKFCAPTVVCNSVLTEDGTAMTYNGVGPGCISLSATQICVTGPPYNASNAGATTTTTSATFAVGTSGTVASCSTFLAGQGVYIAGAGAAGANYIGSVVSCTGTALTVTPATSTSVATSTLVQHDESAAFQSAITALATTGGTIIVPDGKYLLNGPLQDTGASFTGTTTSGSQSVTVSSTAGLAVGNPIFGAGIRAGTLIGAIGAGSITITAPATASAAVPMHAGGANAVLTMPSLPLGGATQEISIAITGLTPIANFGYTGGTQIVTSANGGALIGGYNAAGSFGGLITANLIIEHLTFSTPISNSCLIFVDGQSLSNLDVEDVLINAGSATTTCSSNAGLIAPRVASNVRNEINKTVVVSAYVGVQIGEHTHIGSLTGGGNFYELMVDDAVSVVGSTSGAEGNSVDYMWCQLCTHGLSAGVSQGAIQVQMADFEVAITDIIFDPNNVLNATITGQVPYADGRSTSTPTAPVINGGSHILFCNIINLVGCGGTLGISNVAGTLVATAPINITAAAGLQTTITSVVAPGSTSGFTGSNLQPALGTGNFTGFTVGAANATNNAALMLFNYAGGTGSSLNFGVLGIFGGTDALHWFPDGHSVFGGPVTVPSLTVNGATTVTAAGSASATPVQVMIPALSNGNFNYELIGAAAATNNSVSVGFNYAGGTGSASNFGVLGIFSGTDALHWFPDGHTVFGGTINTPSLLATGIVDGKVPVTITTGTTATLGGTFKTGYTFNQEATPATAVAYTLPTAATGLQYCVGNSWNGSAATTGVLTVNTSASGQFIIFTDGSLTATGGNVTSGGAAMDFACFVGVDATHWHFKPSSGTWAKH